MFDANPKATPADVFIAGRTTEAIVRAASEAIAKASPKALTLEVDGGSLLVLDVMAALVARFDRKADRRAAKGTADESES